MKQSLLALSLVCCLSSFALTACGDDDSGVTPRDEDSSSSSQNVIQSVDSREKSSNSSRHSGQDPESSNSKKVSSSSKKIASSSSSKNVIQSIDSREKSSSSSSKTVVQSSDSHEQSSSSSSKTVVQSGDSHEQSSSSSSKTVILSSSEGSSSGPANSSSSEYVPFDHSKTLAEDWRVGENAYKQFTDTRNGRSYYYIKIVGENRIGDKDSVTIMAENLNIGEMVSGKKNQNDDDKIERYCYDNDTTKCDEFGGLYQWAEMMQLPSRCNTESCSDLIQPNHQGICPEGWRLMTYKDFYIAWHAETNTHGVEGLRSMYGFNGYNSSGLSFVGAGLRDSDAKFDLLNGAAFWFYPAEYEKKGAIMAQSSSISANNDYPPTQVNDLKVQGSSVRCVMVEKQ